MKASRSAREANYRTLDSPCSLASITLPSCAHTPCLHTLVMAGSLVAVVPRSAASFPCKVICHLANSSGSARNIIACHGSSLNQWKPWGYPLECAAVLRQRLPTIKGRTARPPALQQRCWYGTAQTFRAAAARARNFLKFRTSTRTRASIPARHSDKLRLGSTKKRAICRNDHLVCAGEQRRRDDTKPLHS